MKASIPRGAIVIYVAGALLILALVLGYLLLFPVNGPDLRSVYETTIRKIDLVTTMRINLLAATEAEKSSVMADTDEASQDFAEQSMQASAVVEKTRREFELLLEGNKSGKEADLFCEFSSSWGKLQEIDREVLSLAVQNTNLKALRASFGPAREAIRRMDGALTQLMDATASSPAASGISRLAYEAMSGVFNIYALQSPHIIEADQPKMDEIEIAIKGFAELVHDAFNNLEAVVEKPAKAPLRAAKTFYQDFQSIHAKIISLSRRNTNVRSFAMSLGQRRNVAAQCQETLLALQQVVAGRKFEATR